MKRFQFVWWLLPAAMCFHAAHAQETCIRFYGNGIASPDNDRIKISLTATSPVNVSADFTIECWLKCSSTDNNGTVTAEANGNGWITGNIFFDRDVYGNGDIGDFGLSIGTGTAVPAGQRVVAFGIDRLGSGVTIRGNTNVANNLWHHVAVTRNSATGVVQLFIDGNLDATGTGPTGNINYNIGRPTSYPNSDPFIVLGAEKHDAGAGYPSYNGKMDELRISTNIRYSGTFIPPVAPFITDANTAGLYHFNEGSGTVANDVSGAAGGPSNGILNVGGSPAGPVWVGDSPFTGALPVQWIDVKARKELQKVIINWTITPDSGPSEFEIERSLNGIHFSSIGRVEGRENCSDVCRYSFTDNTPLKGKNYYRIKYISHTGEMQYSMLMNIVFNQLNPYKIYPSRGRLVITSKYLLNELIVWGSDGKRLLERKNVPEGVLYLPLPHTPGVVFVHISMADGKRYTEKIVIR